jgi:hypothetical protein
MDLLERYLRAVGQYLAVETKDDMLAELRANLLSKMDARAEQLGRPLAGSEVAAILREHGRPILVAAQYLPQRYLIGPTMFPIYLLTLQKTAPIVALLYFLVSASVRILSGGTLAAAIGGSLLGLVPVLLLFWGLMTMTFAILDFAQVECGEGSGWQNWDPGKLPPVTRHKKQTSMAGRVADLVVHCLWMLYVFAIPRYPFLILGPGALLLNRVFVPAPVWHIFYVALVVVLLAQLAIKLMALNRGTDQWKEPFALLTKAFGLTPVALLAFAKVYFLPSGSATDLHTLTAVNYWMNVGFKIVLVIAMMELAIQAWKYAQRNIPTQRLAF